MKPIDKLAELYQSSMSAGCSSTGVAAYGCYRRYMQGEISEDEAVCAYMQAITSIAEKNAKIALNVLNNSTQPLIFSSQNVIK